MTTKPSKQSERVVFFPQIQATCLCGRAFYIGHNEQGVPSILHDLQPCRAFLDNDLPDFLHLVREHLTAKAQA